MICMASPDPIAAHGQWPLGHAIWYTISPNKTLYHRTFWEVHDGTEQVVLGKVLNLTVRVAIRFLVMNTGAYLIILLQLASNGERKFYSRLAFLHLS